MRSLLTGVIGVFLIQLNLILTEDMETNSTSHGWYSVVGSKEVRPNKNYHCAVTASVPSTIELEISGKQDSGNDYNASLSVTVEPNITKIVHFQIGHLEPGQYSLKAKSDGELKFSNSTPLDYKSKSVSIFVQTDRAIYKPGAKVQFRILVLNPTLKPINTSDLHVYITDGNDNRLKEWRQGKTSKGVWSGEMQLSDSPVLGNWMIHATALNQTVKKSFEVAEYVLPRFEVNVNVPEHTLFSDSRVAAEITVKYTHGRPVKGDAKISMKLQDFRDTKKVTKEVPIDGQAVVEFDIVKELNLTEDEKQMSPGFGRWRPFYFDDFLRTVKFDASVEEALTGKIQNGSATTSLHKKKYKLDLVKTSDYFKPGLPHTLFVKVTKYDGSPVTSSEHPVKINSSFSYGELGNETSHEIPSSGLIKLTFYPPKNSSVISTEGSFEGTTKRFESISSASSPSGNFIQATVTTEHPKVNSDIDVEVNITEHTPLITYQVFGRGNILLADSVSIDEDKTTATFKYLATADMAPKSQLIVYYIREDGEVVVDVVNIKMDTALQNFVSLDTNVNEVAPGEEIHLKLQAKPNSYVGLLGVDQSVLLLKTGNDILMEDVVNEIKSYSTDSFSWGYGGNTAKKMFEDAGVVVLTNGMIFEPINPFGLVYDSAPVFAMAAMSGPPGKTENRVLFSQTSGTLPAAAFGGVAESGGFAPKPPRLRSSFPETWIWQNVDTDDDGKVSLRKSVPDTITSWVVSAFSLDSNNGLGLLELPRKIKVFRPFFVSLDLPYSIIRGEVVTIPVALFNYLDMDITADVTLENNAAQFEFTDYSRNGSDTEKLEPFRTKRVTVKPNSGEKTSFTITATELGFIGIKVTAKSQLAGDAVERKLLVKPEGETQYKNDAIFVDLRNKNSMSEHIKLDMPKDFVEGSARVEVSAVGDILGTSLQNLEKLIRMPFGCGEQNMLNFVPNIVVLDYLKNSGQLLPAIEGKCLKYMEVGYQRELSYKHNDGSFSAFGNHDRSGSTWLTAFVLKSFASAEPYMNIDSKVMDEGLAWLARKQAMNGSFPEVGTVSHKDMQGGSGKGLALTSFSLLPFLAHNKSEHAKTVEKALNYIVKELDNIKNDSYSLAISTYALHLADHPDKDKAFNMLEANAESTNQGSMKRWKRMAKKSDDDNPHARIPNSVDVEMTAYAMLVYLDRGLTENCMPVMNWLLSQQNSDGGFASTQDTVVALTALSKLAAKIADKNPDMAVNFQYDENSSEEIKINSDNALVLQKKQLPNKIRELNVSAKGKGFAVVQVSHSYNVNVNGAWPMFNLIPKVNDNSNENTLLLDICSSFVTGLEGDNEESSNMVVMEVSLPSGYTVDHDSLPSLQESQDVKRIELKEGDTQIVLYFDKMTKDELCSTITAYKAHQVSNQKPVPVTMYDYYDQSRRARAFYSLPSSA